MPNEKGRPSQKPGKNWSRPEIVEMKDSLADVETGMGTATDGTTEFGS